MLTAIVAYLPRIFVAGLIVVVAGAIAAGAKQLAEAALGGLSYGRIIAVSASVAIWTIGIFAALSQLQIAPAIINGLFYALLAVFAGTLIIAVGGGGIAPMRNHRGRDGGGSDAGNSRRSAKKHAPLITCGKEESLRSW